MATNKPTQRCDICGFYGCICSTSKPNINEPDKHDIFSGWPDFEADLIRAYNQKDDVLFELTLKRIKRILENNSGKAVRT